MPGVLILEAMTQSAALLVATERFNPNKDLFVLATMDRVKFKKPVVPGDQIVFKASLVQFRRQLYKFEGLAFVEGQLVCQANIGISRFNSANVTAPSR